MAPKKKAPSSGTASKAGKKPESAAAKPAADAGSATPTPTDTRPGKRRIEKKGAKKDGKDKSQVEKATRARKSVLRGTRSERSRKIRTSVKFHRPRTLRLLRAPKYPRKSAPGRNRLDQYSIIKYPLTTESAMKKIEDNNTLVFLVHLRSNKPEIKYAVKKLYDIDVAKVNTLIRPDGQKKAYVRLAPDYDALDVANKIGII
ncbi:PREDICTED: 60S ribosomal protein L23a-like isoform X2 [Priapulus caudatus]|uniref:60S ribosomal protein L23a-like isoform X2 n=1 Tax=Priapulus caudatus TaxID=37621 RepID=A0ABM1EGP1_PRICU|nr:PREDICTED: 60S ribosomal protein L23a-like isoform X2 [Priapulus caudatus]